MKYVSALIIVISFPLFLVGQNQNTTNLQIGYYGDIIIHPGFKVGYELPFKNWTTNKTKKGANIEKYKSWNLGMDLTYYKHPKHHDGLIFGPNLSYRRTKENGTFSQFKLGVAYHRSFVTNPTFSVSDLGEVSNEKSAGQNTLFSSLSYGFGKDLRKKKNIPMRFYGELGVYQRTPYNHAFLYGLQIGFGVHYFIK